MVALLPVAAALAIGVFGLLLIRELAPERTERTFGVWLDYAIVALLAAAMLALAELIGAVTA